MFVVYHPGYTVDIGPNHRFPMQKYRLVYERLLAEGTLAQVQVIQPDLAAMADLLLVHTRDYVDRFLTGEMSPKEMATRAGLQPGGRLAPRLCRSRRRLFRIQRHRCGHSRAATRPRATTRRHY